MQSTVDIVKYFFRRFAALVSVAVVAVMSSCSTGIEGTKKIRMNKDDIKLMAKSDEQIFASEIKGIPLKDWKIGRKFMTMNDRALFIFDSSSAINDNSSADGKTLFYTGYKSRITPDLKDECILSFSDGVNSYTYNTGKSTVEALHDIDSSKLPLLADLELIDEWKQKLTGKKLWTKNSLWYDDAGQRKNGLKFAMVEVLDVTPSIGDFPMKVKITCNGDVSYILMNYTADIADSRNFAAIFFLSDPKLKYPDISDENWNLIQMGRVCKGMTKEECRLALGTPDELRAGHNTSQTLDIWQYSNGTYLYFEDGLLISFRQ